MEEYLITGVVYNDRTTTYKVNLVFRDKKKMKEFVRILKKDCNENNLLPEIEIYRIKKVKMKDL